MADSMKDKFNDAKDAVADKMEEAKKAVKDAANKEDSNADGNDEMLAEMKANDEKNTAGKGYHGEGNQAGPGDEYPSNMGGTYAVSYRDDEPAEGDSK